MSDTIKYLLDESAIPEGLVQHRGRPARRRCRRCCTRARCQPIGPDDLAPLFPMALIEQEVSTEREIEIPEPVRDDLPPVAPDAAVPRPPPGEGARYAGEDLLQVRGRQPRRQPQAQHRRAAGLLQQGGRHQTPRHRDRRRPVGLVAGLRRRALRPRGPGLHGASVSYDQKPYRRALMETYGARCVPSPVRAKPTSGRAILAQRPDHPGQPRHRHLRGGRGRRAARRHQVRARQRAQPRAAAPDRHRPGGDEADGDGRRLPGRDHRLHRRRLELRRHRLPVPRREAARRQEGRASSPSSPPPARA